MPTDEEIEDIFADAEPETQPPPPDATAPVWTSPDWGESGEQKGMVAEEPEPPEDEFGPVADEPEPPPPPAEPDPPPVEPVPQPATQAKPQGKQPRRVTAAANPEQVYRQAGFVGELKKQGNKLVGLCPFHEDNVPSFKITLSGEKAWLWYCHGACKTGGSVIDFIKRAGHLATNREAIERTTELLPLSEAAPAPRRKPPAPKAATPPKPLSVKLAQKYCDVLLAKKNENHLRRFMQARALSRAIIEAAQIGLDGQRFTIPVYDETGKLLDIRRYSLDGEPKMLAWEEGRGQTRVYGWQWVADEQEVVLAEGEFDSLALLDRGIPAFSVTNGAGKWPDDPPNLAGKTIHICGDNNGAGRKMNETLPPKLYAAGAARVKIIDWRPDVPKGYDITDYFLDGGTVDGFRNMMLSARIIHQPRRTSWTLKEYRAADFPEPKQIVPGILREGLTVIAARPKVGKTLLLMQIGAGVITGGKVLGRDVEQGAVLLILLEGRDRDLQDRMARQDWPTEGPLDLERAWPLYGEGAIEKLHTALTQKDYLLVGIDTFARFVGSRLDQDKVGEVTAALSDIYAIGVETSTSIVIIDHFNKLKLDDPVDAILGSTAKAAIPDGIIGLYKQPGQATNLLRVVSRDMPELDLPVKLDQQYTLCWQPAADERGVAFDSVQSEVLDAIEAFGGRSYCAELAKATGKDPSNVYHALCQLVDKGALIRGPKEGNIVYYYLPEAFPQIELGE